MLKGITSVDILSTKFAAINEIEDINAKIVNAVYSDTFEKGKKSLNSLEKKTKGAKLRRLIAYYYMKDVTKNKAILFPDGKIEDFKKKLEDLGNYSSGNTGFLTVKIIDFLLRLRPKELEFSPAILGKKDDLLNQLLNYIVNGTDNFNLLEKKQTYNFQERETIFSDYESSLSGAEYDEYSDTEYGEFISNVDKEIEKILEHSSDTGSYDYTSSDSGTYASED